MVEDSEKEQDSENKEVKTDSKKELRETEQEVMFELKLKTDEFIKNRVKMDNI